MFARIALAITTALLTFATLCLWSATTHAAEMRCERRAMVQGVVGEMVTTCELVTSDTKHVKASTSKPRVGLTTVAARLGKRAPVLVMAPLVVRASALRVAALDVDGTCGGLPAVCCDWQRGTRALCGVSQF